MTAVARAPLRVSLGGGGTDVPSYSDDREGFLVSATIDAYVHVVACPAPFGRFRVAHAEVEEADDPAVLRHGIARESLRAHWRGGPLHVTSVSDVPPGTGLGSSGAFCVALMRALAALSGEQAGPEELADRACRIEIDALGEPVGKQDQYAAAVGGLRAYTFHRDGTVTSEPLGLSPGTRRALDDGLLLFHTGRSRSASSILRDQVDRTQADDAAMLDGLDRVKEAGRRGRRLLERGSLEEYAALMHEHWMAKRERSPGMTDGRVDALYERARDAGALGGKLVGAGGGGFLLVYSTDPERTRAAVTCAGAPELPFVLTDSGCELVSAGRPSSAR